jgi:hypothetical protein
LLDLCFSNDTLKDEIFPQRYRAKEARPDSFAEQQARLASDKAYAMENLGENLLQVLQGVFVYCSPSLRAYFHL